MQCVHCGHVFIWACAGMQCDLHATACMYHVTSAAPWSWPCHITIVHNASVSQGREHHAVRVVQFTSAIASSGDSTTGVRALLQWQLQPDEPVWCSWTQHPNLTSAPSLGPNTGPARHRCQLGHEQQKPATCCTAHFVHAAMRASRVRACHACSVSAAASNASADVDGSR
jgi:hypothetical protein